MRYSVVYSSGTGNTRMLAERIQVLLGGECGYAGKPDARAAEADVIFAGFWTDKGSCAKEMADFLETLKGRRVFLFGTAGFGESEEYFESILSRVREHVGESNQVIGTYMCQGKMPAVIRSRYEAKLEEDPERMGMLIANFDKALSHPNESDLERLEQAVKQAAARLSGGRS